MICPECLTWPVTGENELCCKCQREIDAQEPQPPVHFDLGSRGTITVRALGEVRAGQVVLLDHHVSDRHFPDIEQMLEDTHA